MLLTSQRFHGWGTSTLCKTALSSEWRNTVALLRKSLILEARWYSTLFSIVNWGCCLREYSVPLSVSMCEEHHLCANHSIQVNDRKTAPPVRESLMLETRGSSNMDNIVNSVCSLKEYCLPLSVFPEKQHHHCAESPHSSEKEKHCRSCSRSTNVTSKRVLHLVKHGELS
jgi:hypothetical protein